MKRGRPTKKEGQKIKQDILEFYEQDISITVASRHLGVNPKTISKHYKKWDSQRTDPDDKDVMLRIKKTKESSIQNLEKDIIALTLDIVNEDVLMKKSLQKGDIKGYNQISKSKRKNMNERTKRMAAKMNLVGTLTGDVLVKHRELIA